MCIQSLVCILFPRDFFFLNPGGAASVRTCKLPDIKNCTHGCAHIQKLKLFQYQINRRCVLTSV